MDDFSSNLCDSVCSCYDGFAGTACQMTAEEQQILAKSRMMLLTTIGSIRLANNATNQTSTNEPVKEDLSQLEQQANAINGLVAMPEEVDNEANLLAVDLLVSISETMVDNSDDENVANSILPVVSAASYLIESSEINNVSEAEHNEQMAKIADIAGRVSLTSLNNMVIGEEPQEIDTEKLKITNAVVSSTSIATSSFKPPGEKSTTFSFPNGVSSNDNRKLLADGNAGIGVSLLMWGINPHRGSDRRRKLLSNEDNAVVTPTSAVIRMTVLQEDTTTGVDSVRRQRHWRRLGQDDANRRLEDEEQIGTSSVPVSFKTTSNKMFKDEADVINGTLVCDWD